MLVLTHFISFYYGLIVVNLKCLIRETFLLSCPNCFNYKSNYFIVDSVLQFVVVLIHLVTLLLSDCYHAKNAYPKNGHSSISFEKKYFTVHNLSKDTIYLAFLTNNSVHSQNPITERYRIKANLSNIRT